MALVAVLAGCGGDDDGVNDAGPLPVDQCLGSGDMSILQGLEPDGGGAPGELTGMQVVIEGCVRGPCFETILSEEGSFLEGETYTCLHTCLDGSEGAGVSTACRDCYIAAGDCVSAECVVVCLGVDQVACQACIETNCDPGRLECTGLAF